MFHSGPAQRLIPSELFETAVSGESCRDTTGGVSEKSGAVRSDSPEKVWGDTRPDKAVRIVKKKSNFFMLYLLKMFSPSFR
jgi:hypothetical protein